MREMEAGKRSISADELAQFSRIYEVDVRELLFLEFTEAGEEQRLAAKYSSFFKRPHDQTLKVVCDAFVVRNRKARAGVSIKTVKEADAVEKGFREHLRMIWIDFREAWAFSHLD